MKNIRQLILYLSVFTLLYLPALCAENPGLHMSALKSGVNPLTPVDIKITNPWPGRLVYTAFRRGVSTLGVCDTGKSDGVGECRYSEARPSSATQGGIFYAPLLSPDGQKILLRYGEGYEFSDYLFAVFNPDDNTTRVIEPRARYYSTSWSPSGRYIAYISGGDLYGNDTVTFPTDPPTVLSTPLSLQVFDLQTGQNQQVVANDTLNGPLNWKDAITPVYAVLSPEAQRVVNEQNKKRDEAVDKAAQQAKNSIPSISKKTPSPTITAKELAPQPDVFAFNLIRGEQQLLFQDGYRPLPSPDGLWIAFFGSENVEAPIPLRPEWTTVSTGAALCVAQADGQQRLVLNLFADYPQMLWRNDNLHLLTIENKEGDKDRAKFEGTLKEWDIRTGNFRVVTVLHAYDTGTPGYSIIDPKFRFLSISKDGSSAFVVTYENQRDNPQSPKFKVSTLEAIDLENGKVTIIARVKGDYGTRIDWREQITNS